MAHLRKIKQPYGLSIAASIAALVSLERIDELEAVGRKLVRERRPNVHWT